MPVIALILSAATVPDKGKRLDHVRDAIRRKHFGSEIN
jgi:hypothetical protein